MKYLGNVVNAFKILAGSYLKKGMSVLDATCGNGNDSLFLKELIGEEGMLYALDIQEEAIVRTKAILSSRANVKIIKQSHEMLKNLFKEEELDAIVYNLGYLPKGDKAITTRYDSTIESISQALSIIKKGGLIFVLSYRGHLEGELEFQKLSSYLKNISQSEYDIAYIEFINQQNSPPVMWVIERKKVI